MGTEQKDGGTYYHDSRLLIERHINGIMAKSTSATKNRKQDATQRSCEDREETILETFMPSADHVHQWFPVNCPALLARLPTSTYFPSLLADLSQHSGPKKQAESMRRNCIGSQDLSSVINKNSALGLTWGYVAFAYQSTRRTNLYAYSYIIVSVVLFLHTNHKH